MKFNVIKNVVGTLAPTIGSALGGPMGNMAANVIADVLGVKPEPKALQKAMENATPEQMAEIKKAEFEFETQMKELDVDIFALKTGQQESWALPYWADSWGISSWSRCNRPNKTPRL